MPSFPKGSAAADHGGWAPSEPLGLVMLMRRFHPFIGGYQTQSLRLAQALLRRGVDLRVVTGRFGNLAAFENHEGIPIHRVAVFGRGRVSASCYLVSSLAWMARHRNAFQVIHATRVSSGVVAGLIGLVLRKKVLCRPTSGAEVRALGGLKLRWLRRTVHRFAAITPGIESDLKHLGIRPERIVRIDNGMDLDTGAADGGAVRAALGWSERAEVVGFVGRLVPEKGLDWLLDAWADVAARRDGARLLLVGDGPERGPLEARAASLGIADTVAFVGTRKDVFPFLAASDVFVLPSRIEGCSNALLEAMSRGLPVVVADDLLGGNRQIVEDGTEGYVVPFGDTPALGDRIVELLTDAPGRRTMGEKARRRVARERSIDRAAERYAEVYAAMRTDRRAARRPQRALRRTIPSSPVPK